MIRLLAEPQTQQAAAADTLMWVAVTASSLKSDIFAECLSDDLSNRQCFVLDPMIAAVERATAGRGVTIGLGALDGKLNEVGYIVPGWATPGIGCTARFSAQFGTHMQYVCKTAIYRI